MTHLDHLRADPKFNRGFLQEKAMLAFSELVLGLLKQKGMSRLQLARAVGISRKQLSAMLNCEEGAEITIRQASDILYVLGKELEFKIVPKKGK